MPRNKTVLLVSALVIALSASIALWGFVLWKVPLRKMLLSGHRGDVFVRSDISDDIPDSDLKCQLRLIEYDAPIREDNAGRRADAADIGRNFNVTLRAAPWVDSCEATVSCVGYSTFRSQKLKLRQERGSSLRVDLGTITLARVKQ